MEIIKSERTIDRTVHHLCIEIDELKEDVSYWKEMYEKERATNIEMVNKGMVDAKKGIANALMFALSISDDADGNLVINKGDRKRLAKLDTTNNYEQ